MQNSEKSASTAVVGEFTNAELGDERRTKRLSAIARRFEKHPEKSLPAAMSSPAEQEATYRFLNNDSVSFQGILTPHCVKTAHRATKAEAPLVLHDTSEFGFDSQRKGLGRLRGKSSRFGFFAHVSLCVGSAEQRDPLGILAVQPWTRTTQVRQMKKASARKEMHRWFEGVRRAEEQLGSPGTAVHVMDREGDSYELFGQLVEHRCRFVIRACHDRVLVEGSKLFKAIKSAPIRAERTIYVSRRGRALTPKARGIYPERQARQAKLTLRAAALEVQRSGCTTSKQGPKSLTLHVVQVAEEKPPAKQPPVTWLLITTEPIDTPEQIMKVVDIYRARWLIEELFKALKSGCRYLQLQLESYDSLLRALAIYFPVAWQLLRLRYLAAVASERPATSVFNPVQLQVLRAVTPKPLCEPLTIRDALLAVAAQGGHIKNNGDPGWQVLGRGLHDLLLLEQGWRAAMVEQKCDQS